MSKYVLGIDLGTSAVKVSAMNPNGRIVAQAIHHYPLIQPRPGYNEQNLTTGLMGPKPPLNRLFVAVYPLNGFKVSAIQDRCTV